MIVDNPSVLPRHDIIQLSNLIKKAFVTPWVQHLNDVEQRLLNANLTKYATLRIKSKATDKAAAIVANEPSVTPQIMSELIKKAIATETKQLQNKLSKLEQQLNRASSNTSNAINKKSKQSTPSKNDTRGEKKTRASTPNKSKNKIINERKSTPKKQTTSNANSKTKRRAGDVNNGTKSDNKKSSNSNKKTKPNGKTNIIQHAKRNNKQVRNKV
jgi:hypothetical protein